MFAASGSLADTCGGDPECDDVSAWAEFTRIELRASFDGTPEVTSWVASFDHKALDLAIDVDATRGYQEPMAGTVALVGGQVMLTKGLSLKPGYEIDMLDAPILSMRLVMALLNRAFPKGPNQIQGSIDLDHSGSVGIKYATPSASGYIPAPWRVKGKVSRLADRAITFDLALSFPAPQRDGTTREFKGTFVGSLSMTLNAIFRDADLLEGWTTYGLGPQTIKTEKGTIVDYGAKPQEGGGIKTFGDVRALVAKWNHPGVNDPSKDFTGFWKTKCEDAFGLQIKRIGDEGKYSIVFCGPGGCGDPSRHPPTFITGDEHFEVVSESELVQIRRSGERDTYLRCTKDTNPVLKYRD